MRTHPWVLLPHTDQSAGVKANPICPFHNAKHLLHTLEACGLLNADSPMLPTATGTTMSSQNCKDTIAILIALVGGTDPTQGKTTLPGEHILRVAGAQMMSRAHIPLSIIQLIGRWGSDAVKRYVQEAELHNSHYLASQVTGRLGHPAPSSSSSSHQPMTICPGTLTPSPLVIVPVLPDVCAPQEPLTKATLDRQAIQNPRSGKLHRARWDETRHDSVHWSMWCGWPYGTTNHRKIMDPKPNDWRTKCITLSNMDASILQIPESDSGSDAE